MKNILLCIVILSSFFLGACHEKKPMRTQKIITVKKAPVYKQLYFSGTLLPGKMFNVTAPSDGAIVSQSFSYGQEIKKGQKLFTLKSTKIRKDFEDALTAYLKAKEDYNHQSSNFKSEASLYKNQLISRDEYQQAQSAFYLSRLALLQAELALKKATRYIPDAKKLYALSISDIKKITKTFADDKSIDDITIHAPAGGTALFPAKKDNDEKSSQKIQVGSMVKQGQLLVTIGVSKDLSLSAKASEIEINTLKTGMPVTVTSIALPGQTLHGHISAIDNQAVDSESLPQFNLKILVDKIPPAAKNLLHIGIDAKASIKITEKNAIQIPIDAVRQNPKTGESTVLLINPETKKTKSQTIVTGKTQADSVVVLQGLKAGDQILE